MNWNLELELLTWKKNGMMKSDVDCLPGWARDERIYNCEQPPHKKEVMTTIRRILAGTLRNLADALYPQPPMKVQEE